MYAVIESGGKQYRVELGSVLELDRLDAAPGATLAVERVLLVADGDQAQIGQPLVEGASVSLEVVGQIRGEKIVVFKYRPKARHRAKQGHRQELTRVRVADITVGGRSAASEQADQKQTAGKARAAAQQQAAEKAAADAALAAKLAKALADEQPSEPAQPATATRAKGRAAAAKVAAAKASAKATKPKASAKASPAKPASKATARPANETKTSRTSKPAARARRTTKKDE